MHILSILPMLALAPHAEPGTGFPIEVHNHCGHPVHVAIRFKPVDGPWATQGWWAVDAHAQLRLHGDGQALRTSQQRLYFAARATDGEPLAWTGHHEVAIGGHVVPMRAIDDDEGSTHIRLTCQTR